MPDEVVVQGRIVAGEIKLEPTDRALLVETARRWPDGSVVTLTASRVWARLSDLQRAYWFAVVVPRVADYTGDEQDAVHDDLLRVYGPRVTKRWKNAKTGKRKQRVHRPSLMSLSSREMTELIDRVRRDFGDQGVIIDPPDPAWRARKRRAASEAA